MKKIKFIKKLICLFVAAFIFFLAPSHAFAIGEFDTSEAPSAAKYGMTPISCSELNDGSYDIIVLSSSSFFKPELSKLVVKDGNFSANVKIKSKSYGYIFMGNAEEAVKADKSELIPITVSGDSSYFELPVNALNKDIPCAAFSIKREKWYNRNLVFDASSLPNKALNFGTPNYDLIEKATKEYIDTHDLDEDILNEKPKQIETGEDQNAAKKIIAVALVIIVIGGILNHFVKRKRR
ncbi:MAG: hypothetical protein SPI74_04645 [Eubacterium sp.]|nr:hypothetical protein [Eubacterium sp.]